MVGKTDRQDEHGMANDAGRDREPGTKQPESTELRNGAAFEQHQGRRRRRESGEGGGHVFLVTLRIENRGQRLHCNMAACPALPTLWRSVTIPTRPVVARTVRQS